MKIGILCTGRCGSTSLYEGIKESICKKDDYQFYFENNKGGNLINGKRQSINFIDKNILAKDLITSMPCDFWHTLSIKKLINNLSNFYINYAQNFDIIILLCVCVLNLMMSPFFILAVKSLATEEMMKVALPKRHTRTSLIEM